MPYFLNTSPRCSISLPPEYNHWMSMTHKSEQMHGTTVLCVRKDNKVVLTADGQVTLGDGVIKHSAKKTRRLYNDKIIAGFAGSTADALALFSRFEAKLQEFHGNLARAAVELAKDWRTERSLRHLDALLVVADTKGTFLISGTVFAPLALAVRMHSLRPALFRNSRNLAPRKSHPRPCASPVRSAFTRIPISRLKSYDGENRERNGYLSPGWRAAPARAGAASVV
jgi:hypothetical protein